MKERRVHTEVTENHGEPQSAPVSHDEALETIFQANHVEIHQQTDLVPGQAQIGQQLRLVDRKHPLHRLDFQDQFISDDDVGPEPFIQQPIAIDDRHSDLPLKRNTRFRQFEAKTFLINRLQQPWAKLLVHLDRQPDDSLGQFALNQHNTPQWLSVVPRVLRVEP